jgi:hypothetical protein
MSRVRLIPLLAVCLIAPAGVPVFGQDKMLEKQVAELEVVKAQFIKDKDAAKQRVLSQFDTLMQRVMKSSKVSAADRLSLVDRLRAERKVFAEKEDLPENSDVLPAAWDYGTAVVKKYKPVSNKFDHVMNACLKAGKTDQAEELKTEKQEFDNEHLPGKKHFIAGAMWDGTQYEGSNGSLLRFRVIELQGTLFKAQLEKNLQFAGHPIMNISGSLDGILVRCTSLIPVQGNIPLVHCEGFVLGQTLMLKLITAQRKGLPTVTYAVLRKK